VLVPGVAEVVAGQANGAYPVAVEGSQWLDHLLARHRVEELVPIGFLCPAHSLADVEREVPMSH